MSMRALSLHRALRMRTTRIKSSLGSRPNVEVMSSVGRLAGVAGAAADAAAADP